MYTLLFVFWLVLNGKLTAEILLTGIVLTVAIGALMYVLLGYTPAREWRFLKKVPLFFLYVFVLIWEIIKANAGMISVIFNKKRRIEPALVTFRTGLKTRFGRFILANSITLTPGTITIRVDGDRFVVHCLAPEFLDVSENSVFLRWIRRLEA